MDDWSSTVSSAKVSKPHHGDILSYGDSGGACDKPEIGGQDKPHQVPKSVYSLYLRNQMVWTFHISNLD